jgi:hypothetical protein
MNMNTNMNSNMNGKRKKRANHNKSLDRSKFAQVFNESIIGQNLFPDGISDKMLVNLHNSFEQCKPGLIGMKASCEEEVILASFGSLRKYFKLIQNKGEPVGGLTCPSSGSDDQGLTAFVNQHLR